VLTIPDTLRPFFEDWKMLKLLMDVAVKVVKDVIKWKMVKEITPGLIVILHTFGKDIKHNPHLHCLLTEGGERWYLGGYWDLSL
jgi:Putative transposase.